MKCKYCSSLEELKWPENYKKGDKPVNNVTNRTHKCLGPTQKGFIKYYCPECGIEIHHNRKFYQSNEPCEDCKNVSM